jgi:FkbM family methyltransferase
MKHNHPFLFRLSRIINGFVATSPTLTKAYLLAWSFLLRSGYSFPLKRNMAINLYGYNWPSVRFNPRSVNVTDQCAINLIPNVGEFDFNTLFSKELGYESELFKLLSKRVRKYDAIIEIGANVGVYTSFFSVLLGSLGLSTPVFAFEPSRKAFKRLQENLKANSAKNVYAFNLAIADESRFLRFFEPEGHLTNGSLAVDFAANFSDHVVETIVPSFAAYQLIELVSRHTKVLVKIDVEGAEEVVLKSLSPVILEKRPEIILEVLRTYEQRLNEISVLREHYDFYLVTPNGLEQRKTLEAHPCYRDYLLVPHGEIDEHGLVP